VATTEVERIGALLKGTPLFSTLTAPELSALSRVFREVTCPKGSIIVKESEPSRDFFVLVNGSVRVESQGKTLATLGPGQFFGELTAVGFQRTRTADVVAIESCSCLVIGRDNLEALISGHSSVSSKILKEIHDRYLKDGLTWPSL
jgi:CRP-like cAMP-binding protein